ncbi:prolipoprotein diacylglyceryl transferase [Spiroplasma endosymbiont of Amphibalanus improvisus]|uniref:prolipoprotein diacylglyceryl transferase n=1 Tax=Spiroplasma endosymbiont of Amphibalanus improvisus TaxID=3066327 RepID=UPI00313C305A
MSLILSSLLGLDPTSITPDNTPYNIKSDYGFFHVYAFTMTFGVIIAILASIIKLNRKNVPLDSLYLSVIFIIPLSLLGASFFGKFGVENSNDKWYEWFYFWNGGMSIHGGVLFGAFAGIIYFYFVGKRRNISLFVYMDAILPNILLGQIIGRWGNFFNHELLGSPTTYESLSWLPHFIRDNCFTFQGNHPEWIPNSHNLEIQYRQPIFLYESMGNTLAWIVITFFVPNMFKFRKCNSYKKYNYSFKSNMKYLFGNKKQQVKGITNKAVWNKSYFEYKPELKEQLKIENDHFSRKDYATKINQMYNPNNEKIVRCGVEAGLYFAFWNLVRIILETQREPDIYFIRNHAIIDFTVLGSIIFWGFALAVYCQFWAPHFRRIGIIYEKNYYNMKNIQNWDLDWKIKSKLNYVANNEKQIEKVFLLEIQKFLETDVNKDDFEKIKIIAKNKYCYNIKFLLKKEITKKYKLVYEECSIIIDIAVPLNKMLKNIKFDISDFNLFNTSKFQKKLNIFIHQQNIDSGQIHNVIGAIRQDFESLNLKLVTKTHIKGYNIIMLSIDKNIQTSEIKEINGLFNKKIIFLAR